MRPSRISVKNFCGYVEADLDLSSIGIAACVGGNGAGKSSILVDAITFALFGVGRSTSADDLVRLGESEMSVELTFELGAHVYRVQRSRRRAKDSSLQFQQQHGTGWKALTGSSIRATQAVIEQTLRLSYEGFVSSAFVLQGDAGRFTGATPAARKAVLAEILGLDEWSALNEDFRALASETRGQFSVIAMRVDDLQQRYDDLDHAEATVAEAKRAHDAAVETLRAARDEHAAVSTAHAQAEALLARERECRARLLKAENELQKTKCDRIAILSRLLECRNVISNAERIRAAAHTYRSLATERDDLSRKQSELCTLEGKRHLQERTLEAERNRLQTELRLAEQQQRDLQARAAKLDAVKAEDATVRKAVEALAEVEQELAGTVAQIQTLRELRSEDAAHREIYRTQQRTLTERIASFPADTAPCPTCGNVLSPEQRTEHLANLKHELDSLEHTIGQLTASISEVDQETKLVQETKVKLEQKLRDGQPHRDRLVQLRTEYTQANDAAQALPAVELRVAELRQALLAPHVGAANALAETKQAIAALGYDEVRHLACQTQLAGLANAVRDLHQLEAAERELPGLEQQEVALRATERDREETIATEKEAIAEMGDLSDLPSPEELARTETAVHQAEHAERLASQTLGGARQTVAALEALGPELEAATRERDRLAQLAADYAALANACGHKGVPALLIEHAIPEIERSANELLDIMGGEMRVRFVSQREGKTGAAIETLGIIISDTAGERDMSLYSGGERGRIDLALRIALTRLLTARSEATVNCLVLDEGCSSQDDQGRENMVQAILSVKDLFGLVLIITHQTELRERFGTQILVSRGENGSQVEVMG